MKMKIAKIILIPAFLFSLAYANKDAMPYPAELKTMDFIISSGVDVDLNAEKSEEKCSISYVTDEQTSSESHSNAGKKIFNIKSDTIIRTMDKLQSITNKSLNSSHMEYVLIGEQTAKENLEYFAKHYSKTPKLRLDVNTFIVKDMTSEEFLRKALTSDININDRLNGIVNNREQLSSLIKRNLKDLLQLTYSKSRTGVIPALEIVESPEQTPNSKSNSTPAPTSGNGGSGDKGEDTNKNQESQKKDNKSYTFSYYGLGIIKDGKLVDYLPLELIRPYLILTKSLKNTTIEIKNTGMYHENGEEIFFIFQAEKSSNKISFKFDGDKLLKVIFDIDVETSYGETDMPYTSDTSNGNYLDNLNELQKDAIKGEIEKIIYISKKLDADFLGIGETLSIHHPYKWHSLEDDWESVFKNLEYEINVSVKTKRYYNIK